MDKTAVQMINPNIPSTDMKNAGQFVKEALEKARKAKERIDEAILSTTKNTEKCHPLERIMIVSTESMEEDSTEDGESSAFSTAEEDSEDEDTEIVSVQKEDTDDDNYSDIDDEDSVESDGGQVLERVHLTKKGVLDLTLENGNNKNPDSHSGEKKKQDEFIVLCESKITTLSDTDSSGGKKPRTMVSDEGSTSTDFSNQIPSSSTMPEKPLKGGNEGGDTGSSDNSSNDTQNSTEAFNVSEEPSFPVVDPEYMENQWLAKLYQRFHRPAWDSSPYKSSCNRPAWDENLYKEARERFRRHESVKMHGTGMEFQPFLGATFPGMSSPGAPFLNISKLQKNCFQLGSTCKMVRILQATVGGPALQKDSSKQSSSDMTPSDHGGGGGPSAKQSGATTTTLGSSKESTSAGAKQIESTNCETPTRRFPGTNFRLRRRTGSLDNRGFSSRKSMEISSTVRARTLSRQDYNSSLKQVPNSQGNRKKTHGNDKNSEQPVKQPERPRIMNPLPRVAMLSKASLRKSNLGQNPQTFDERGRVKPTWDPSPFIPIGKKNAWEETMPKSDYYRLKYFGWL